MLKNSSLLKLTKYQDSAAQAELEAFFLGDDIPNFRNKTTELRGLTQLFVKKLRIRTQRMLDLNGLQKMQELIV